MFRFLPIEGVICIPIVADFYIMPQTVEIIIKGLIRGQNLQNRDPEFPKHPFT